ncbi:MAG: GNAT family N-acetyltransferase [Burkholderiaceae bacterium]|nr:GNAT family N-acetyltransferase [Burkholderiaceae bacterium]
MNSATALLRQAQRADIGAIQRVRRSVRENRLLSSVITKADVQEAIEATGRGWVIEADGEVVAFAIGNATDRNIWALSVDPVHERRGYGRRLHDAIVNWLRSQGLRRLWLTTEPGKRAERFYTAAGRRHAGIAERGEIRFERDRPRDA